MRSRKLIYDAEVEVWLTSATARTAKHGAFLQMMGLHPVQDMVKEPNGLEDVLAFVQHDALGAHAHGGIGYFRA